MRWFLTIMAFWWLFAVFYDDPKQHLALSRLILDYFVTGGLTVLAVSSWLDFRNEKRKQKPE